MRILFDANVLYSAFTSKGVCEDVVEHAAGECELCWSRPLQSELETALRRKYKFGPATEAALAAYAELCQFVEPAPLPSAVCRDRDDDVVLATAVAGEADYIVTGDEDLLTLKRYRNIPIVSPREFWTLIAG